MKTRNITLSLPDDLIRQAKVLAAQRDTSVSAMVRSMLERAIGDESNAGIWDAEEAEMRAGSLEVGTVSWTREDLHQRG